MWTLHEPRDAGSSKLPPGDWDASIDPEVCVCVRGVCCSPAGRETESGAARERFGYELAHPADTSRTDRASVLGLLSRWRLSKHQGMVSRSR
jgi:hypothetical protein